MAHPLISTHHLEDTKSLGFLATIQSRSTNLCPNLLDTVTSVTSVTLIHVVGSVARAWIRASPLHLTRGPQGAYRSTGQSKIVSFSDPIPFLVSPTCVQLWVPVLWQVFFPFKEGFFLQGNRPDLQTSMTKNRWMLHVTIAQNLMVSDLMFMKIVPLCSPT